jgi:DNA-binding CsgD family transcriptional regulator
MRAIALLDDGLTSCRDPILRGRLLNIRAHIERQAGDARIAFPWFTESAELLDDVSPVDAAGARIGAWRASLLAGNGEQLAVAQALMDHAELDGGIQEFLACLALGVEHPDPERRRELRERAKFLVEERGDEVFSEAPRYVSLAGMAATSMANGLSICTWAVNWARENGVYGALPAALYRRSNLERVLGEWGTSYATASEALMLAAENGARYFQLGCLRDLAELEALRGEEPECRAHVEDARALAPSVGGSTGDNEQATIGLLELSVGRYEAAVAAYEPLVLRGVHTRARRGPGEVDYESMFANLIEAYVRLGRIADAERLIEQRATHSETGSASAAAGMARCRGLVAGEDDLERHFHEALELHARAGESFGEARTRLCYGERLRRVQRRRDARDQLRMALETFERLGAAPWVERARAELRATGERVRARGPEHEELTAQELRIAQLAAEGKTNRQIGVAMFLSPKTVEFHLGRAYRKLGISSRAELIRHFVSGARRGRK